MSVNNQHDPYASYRPPTSLAGENPFNLSKMGYANPVANERSLPSAMKSRPMIPRTPHKNLGLQSQAEKLSGEFA